MQVRTWMLLGMVGLGLVGCRTRGKHGVHASEATLTSADAPLPKDGVSEDVVRLVQVSSFTGPQAGLGTELYRGAQSYFLEVNANGGIHGRKIELVPIDDRYSSEVAEEATERAVTDERAFALFGASGTEPVAGILKTLKKHETEPTFLWGSSSPAEASREGPLAPFAFNVRGSVKTAARDVVKALGAASLTKVAIVAQDNAFGKSCAAAARKAAEERGLAVVAEATVSGGLRPDDASKNALDVVRTLRNAGAEALILGMTYNPGAVVTRDAREEGWNVPVAVMGTPDTMVRHLVAHEHKTGRRMTNGLLGCVFAPPVSAKTLPAVQDFRALMEKRNPQVPQEIADPNYRPLRASSSALEGYLMARVLGEALERAGRNLTRDSLRRAAESIVDWDPGIGQAITFGPGDNQGLDHVWIAGVKDEELAVVEDLKGYLTEKPAPVVVGKVERAKTPVPAAPTRR